MEKKYVKSRIAKSFVERTAPTSITYLLVFAFFAYNKAGEHSNQDIVFWISIALFINALIRVNVARLYYQKRLSLFKSYFYTILLIAINGVGWIGITAAVLFAEKMDYVGVALVTLCSFVFVANAIFHLAPILYFLVFYAFITLAPIVLKTFNLMENGFNHGLYSLDILIGVYIFYVIKQGRLVNKEEKQLFAGEYKMKRNYAKLEKAKKELESHSLTTFHNERLSSLGEMSSSIAHEINNPLTIIAGNVQLLLKHPENLDEKVLDKVQKIHFATERIGRIIKTMKLFSSKSQLNHISPTELHRIIDESLSLCTDRMKTSGIKLVVECDDLKANCNLVQVSQIILNLLNNAIDALDALNIEGKQINLIAKEDGKNILVRVVNSGPVISDEIRQKLFTPFFTSKALGKGTGLGLSISKKLAENNNGNLKFEEYEGKTSFLIILKKS